MARIDELRPDQRAALQLLLQQGRSYDDIATLLRIETRAVRERAHAALDALGPEDVPGLSLADQDDVADYLLGQQSASQRAATRSFLESSAAGRAWARVVAGELRPLAGDNLPEIPAEAAEVSEAFDALEARTTHRERVERSSRVGGAILIVAAVVTLVGLVLLGISVLGDDDDEQEDSAARTTETRPQTTTQPAPEVLAQINLTPPGGGRRPIGVAQIRRQGGEREIVLVATGFRPANENRFYAIWMYSSPEKAERLGFPDPQPGRDGRLASQFPYPPNADEFEDLIITQESEQAPERPGEILVSGPIEGVPVSPGEGGQGGQGGEGGQGEGTATAP
ncbi:MAG TPA: sigma-70 region 4 domain-containing protein [Solirubrobacteraceae bacterium]|nr:sigma-70 region 4 domain-containing protein [Solirubrobacteraceae bacterium]